MTFRTERDSLGEIQIPEYALWGAQTQRAIVHFPNLGYSMPHGVIQALALIKKAAALANLELGELQSKQSSLIIAACDEVLSHRHDEQFPLSIWQSGSGTQSNMNMNEVVANRANELAGQDPPSDFPPATMPSRTDHMIFSQFMYVVWKRFCENCMIFVRFQRYYSTRRTRGGVRQ